MFAQIRNDLACFAAGCFNSSLFPVASLGVVIVALSASPSLGDPLAYWRFGDEGTTPEVGDWVNPTSGLTEIEVDADPGTPPAFIPGFDSSGNGNTLYTWDDNSTGHQYSDEVPANSVGGSSNDWSIVNNGGFPASFSWSPQTNPTGTDLQTVTPSQWTIEASVRPSAVDGQFRTFVGRDGNDVYTNGPDADPNAAPLYFQVTNTNEFRINYVDAAGNQHLATADFPVLAHQWYHVAATSDGSTLSLYVDQFDGTGYQLAASTDLTGSANSAMADPGIDANGDTWSWTVGRGRYGESDDPTQNHGDRFFGNIDEVRISDNAVATGSFLFAGQNQSHGPRLIVNRDTGEFTLTNLQASFDMTSYTITSASGALDPANWNSITDNQDADSGGGFDPNDSWAKVTETNNEWTESELIGDGGDLGSVVLGSANAWTISRFEDIEMTVEELLPNFDTRSFSIPVQFVGGLGAAAERSDLDLDGDVDADDWEIFRANHLTDLSSLTAAASSVLGDLDGDLDNDFVDFRLFQGDFDGANGVGALASLVSATVPEPSTSVLLLAACGMLGLNGRRSKTRVA